MFTKVTIEEPHMMSNACLLQKINKGAEFISIIPKSSDISSTTKFRKGYLKILSSMDPIVLKKRALTENL